MTTQGTLCKEEVLTAVAYFLYQTKGVDVAVNDLEILYDCSWDWYLKWKLPEKFEHAIDLGGESG